MFLKWGYFSYRFRKIIPWVMLLLILGLFLGWGTRLDSRLSQEGWEDPGAASTTAAAIEQEVFGRDDSGDVILLYESPAGVDDPAVTAAATAHLGSLRERHPEQISNIVSWFDNRNRQLISEDGTTAFAAVSLAGDGEQTLKDYRIIEDALRAPDAELPPGMTVQVAGATAVADALDEGMATDIQRAERIGLPFVAVVLLFVFGSVVAAAMPLIVGVFSIMGALGILSMIAGVLQVNVFSQAVVTILGLGLAIDYGLFMVSRFREELDKGRSVEDAVAYTTQHAGRTVVFSALMVVVALSGLLMMPQAFLKSVSYGAMAAIGLAALLSVTVLPSLFGLLGHRIDMWSLRRTRRTARRLEDTVWFRIPRWAIRHARPVTVVSAGLLILMTLPVAGIKFGGINETYLPPTQETRLAQDEFNQKFPEFRTEPIKLVVTGADNSQLVDVIMQTRTIEGLTAPMAPSTRTVDGTTVLSAGIADREDNAYVMEQLRAIEAPEGVELYIGGTPAMEIESIEALLERLPWLMAYMVVVTFILMALLFGSLVLPAKAVIMNFLGIGATVGLLTLMFVDGLGAGPLNFTPGPLMSPVLVLIVVILYGLSTDYEVFLVSRMVEARDKGASTDEAVTYGTARTGSIITAAALIMIVVAAAFAFSDIVMMKYIAFGMIFSLAIDATIIRLLLVPTVMHLLREDNWWAPRAVKAAYHRIGGHAAGDEDEDFRGRPVREAEPTPAGPAPAATGAATGTADSRERAGSGVAVLEREEGAAPAVAEAEPASETDPEPEHAEPEPAEPEVPVEEAVVVEEDSAARGGVSTEEDAELVPFAELMARLRGQGYEAHTQEETEEPAARSGHRYLRETGQERE